jgi:histidine kinase
MRRAVTGLFALSVLLSLVLLYAYEAAIASYYRGEKSFLTAIFKPSPPLAPSTYSADTLFREFNALLLASPEGAESRGRLAHIGDKAGTLIVALRRDETLVYASRPISSEAERELPPFGVLEQEVRPEDEMGRTHLYAIRQLDFLATDGARMTFFVLRPPDRARNYSIPYTRQLALVAALFLLAADGAVGVYFTLRITASLGKLEVVATRMGSGDLETHVGSAYQFKELVSVFGVLETMRVQIADLLRREREREAGRRELIANLSHDLRTPIAAVRGYVDGLREGIADTPEKSGRYLAVISDKVALLERMIGEIFLLSTIEEGEAPPTRERIELGAFLRAGIDEIRGALSEERARISDLEGPQRPFVVNADPGQLKRVVENLVDNAVRHGGRMPVHVVFSLEEAAAPASSTGEVRVREGRAVSGAAAADAGPSLVRLRVEDDGRGIPEAERERIFERFYRGKAERPGGGAGLGLAIARRLVEANGGTIRAEAARIGGAAMIIEFPLVEA